MILAVLSGEKSVEDASREAEISPAQYYQFEKKALSAMLAALVPGASTDGSNAPATKQLAERVAALEVAKRRLERLLFLTRLTVKPGPITTGKRGRPKKTKAPVSEPDGAKRSLFTKKKWTARRAKVSSSPPPSPSTPKPVGADAP